jgi:hypothetical protein
MSREDTELLYAKKAATVQEAVDAAAAGHGKNATWAYMPAGSVSLPVPRK